MKYQAASKDDKPKHQETRKNFSSPEAIVELFHKLERVSNQPIQTGENCKDEPKDIFRKHVSQNYTDFEKNKGKVIEKNEVAVCDIETLKIPNSTISSALCGVEKHTPMVQPQADNEMQTDIVDDNEIQAEKNTEDNFVDDTKEGATTQMHPGFKSC